MIHCSRMPFGFALLLLVAFLSVRTSPAASNPRLAEILSLPKLQPADWQDLFLFAESGDREAQYWLGVLYDRGDLLPLDKAKSNYWFQKSADLGYARAEYVICYQQAQPDSLDHERCLRWGAENGVPEAQLWLAVSFDQRWFGVTDHDQALKWFRKAAEAGNVDAEFELGTRYEAGEGVEQNYVEAAYWYRRASEHVPNLGGAGQARFHLGLLYMNGEGVPPDFVSAYMWFTLSGNDHYLTTVQRFMTSSQVSRAQQLAAEWQKQHPDPAIY